MQDIDEYLDRFLERIYQLGPALETIFWQFPPSFQKNRVRLLSFLKKLPDDTKFAFEFRDTSWLNADVYDLFMDNNSAIVWQSSGKLPDDCTPTADFVYLRFSWFNGL